MQKQSPEQTNHRIPPNHKGKKRTSSLVNAALLKVILSAIAEKPRSKADITRLSGLQKGTVGRWINLLHVRKGDIKNLVYIAEWGKAGQKQHPVALWGLGYGKEDAIKPEAKKNAECTKAWRRKQLKSKVIETQQGVRHVLR